MKIACRVPNGIMIRLLMPAPGNGMGDRPWVTDGLGVRLNGTSALHAGAGVSGSDADPGITEVDDAWWAAWLAQNETNPLIVSGQVFEFKDDPANPTT